MTEWPDIRRLDDGVIDYDFYRDRAHLLRIRAMRNLLDVAIPSSKPAAMAMVAAMALVVLALVE